VWLITSSTCGTAQELANLMCTGNALKKVIAFWEPFADMEEDVRDMLRDFLLDLTRTGTPAKKKLAASLLA
jgi:hypothetical protein